MALTEAIALGLWGLTGALSLVLTGRAAAGAFDEAVPGILPVAATIASLAAGLAGWTLFHRSGRRGDVLRRLLDGLLAITPAALIGFSTSATATSLTLAGVASLLTLGICWLVVQEAIRPIPGAPGTGTAGSCEAAVTEAPLAAWCDEATGWAGRSTSALDEHICEHFTRRPLDGGEQIEAVVFARFEAGARQTVVHLPIHPVLRSRPIVECEPLDDASITTTVAAAHTYGIRIDVKRTEQTEVATAIPVGLLVTTQAIGETAA